jgi:hypothetical protein
MIDDVFVFDCVIHVYDFSEENTRTERRDIEPWKDHWMRVTDRSRFRDGVGKFTPEGFDWIPRRFTLDDMYEMEFELSPVDMAMAHAVPVWDWFKDGVAPINAQHAFAAAHPDRVLLCGAVDPLYHGVEGAKQEMRRQVEELGARSIKFYNGHVDASWDCDDPALAYPLYECAQELGIEVLQFHKGLPLGLWPIEKLRPVDLQRPARDFPDMTFVIHHLSLPAYFEETVSIASRFPNVYLALSGVLSVARIAPRKVQTQMGELLQHVGPEKLLWGSEAAMTGPPGPFLELFMDLEIPDDLREGYGYPQITMADKRMILGENTARLFGIDIPTKMTELGLVAPVS